MPEHGVRAGAQTQGAGQPGSRFTTEGMAERQQSSSLRVCTALMSAGQRADALCECATGAGGTRALEAVHLNSQHDPPLEHWPLFQVAHIAAVSPVAPAAADWARRGANCAAGLDSDRVALLIGVDDALAHAGKNSVEAAEHLIHMTHQLGSTGRKSRRRAGRHTNCGRPEFASAYGRTTDRVRS
jgi:hypothetical protein